tara:strand:+ start:131 stop:394 length:264 start_codon:yes stop_codon:yes gene_type:complete
MNTKDWKQKELNRLLMEKFNLSTPELEEEAEIDESHCGGKRDEEELEEGKDQDDDGDSDFADVQMARMKKSGMSDEQAKEKTRKHND